MTKPTADDINRLEKAAWDANVDQVLVWERVQSERMERQFTALRRALADLEAELRKGGADSDGHDNVTLKTLRRRSLLLADRIAAMLAAHPAP